jgi:hypothetical protein
MTPNILAELDLGGGAENLTQKGVRAGFHYSR